MQKSGQYLGALNWFRSVYAHDLKSDERKIYHGLALETATNVPPNFIPTSDWLLAGLNPHEIVTQRPNAYTSFTLMALIRCLLDFADAEFTRSTSESLPRARALYVTALDLLRQPELQRPTNNPFPPNPMLQALQIHTEMNLYKLRNGRNIAGLERQSGTEVLPAGTLGGLPVLNGSGQLRLSTATTLRPTPYRYVVLMERAKQLGTIAQQIEAALLSALARYAYFLQQATATAQLAQNQLVFERQEAPPEFIQADYWQTQSDTNSGTSPAGPTPDRRRLTGSVRLLQDMYTLDQYAFETNKRKLQLSQTFSLAQLDPG